MQSNLPVQNHSTRLSRFCRPQNIETPVMSSFASLFFSTPVYLASVIFEAAKDGSLEKKVHEGADINATDSCGSTALHLASESGDDNIVEVLLREPKINLNIKNNDGLTALHLAAYKGHEKIVSALILSGANINIEQNKKLWTPLHYAACYGQTTVVKLLVEAKAKPNLLAIVDFLSKEAWAPIHFAVYLGYTEILKILIDAGPDLEIQGKNTLTPMCVAVSEENLSAVRVLVSAGAKFKSAKTDAVLVAISENMDEILNYLVIAGACDNEIEVYLQKISDFVWSKGEFFVPNTLEHIDRLYLRKETTLIHLASFYNYSEIVRLQISLNPKLIFEKDNCGQTALHIAALQGHTDIVQFLTRTRNKFDSKEVWIDLLDNKNFSALHLAFINNHEDIAKILILAGANIDLLDQSKKTPLHYACLNGDTENTKLLINCGARLNELNYRANTPVHIASGLGYFEIVKLLVDAGALVNIENHLGETSLHIACKNNYIEIVKTLIYADASVNSENKRGQTPLHIALSTSNLDLMKLLVAGGAHPNIKDKHKVTPLHFASKYGNKDLVQELIVAGASLDIQDTFLYTALHKACENGHSKVVKLLIEGGAKLYFLDRYRRRPIMIAKEKGYSEIVEFLNDVKSKENLGWTPLHFASYGNNLEIVKYLASLLIKEDTDKVNFQNKDGETALFFATQNGQLEIFTTLLSAKAKFDLQNNQGETVLYIAASKGHMHIVASTIEIGANLNLPNNSGDTPLIAAFKNKNFDIVELLIKAGADINVGDRDGFTLLHMAAQVGHDEIVKLLIAAGAKLDLKIKIREEEQSPFDLALKHGHDETAKILKNILFKQNSCNWQSIHVAACNGYLEIVKLLVSAGIDLNSETVESFTPLKLADANRHTNISKLIEDIQVKIKREGFTPFLLAVYLGHIEMVKNHIENNKIDINSANKFGFTALHLACAFGHTEIVKYLLSHEAKITILNNAGQTALQVAQHEGYSEISYILDYTLAFLEADAELNKEIIPAKNTQIITIDRKMLRSKENLNILTKAGLEKIKTGPNGLIKNYNWCINPDLLKEEPNLLEDADEAFIIEGEFEPKIVEKMRAYKISNKAPEVIKEVFKEIKKIKDNHKCTNDVMSNTLALHFPHENLNNFIPAYLKNDFIIKAKIHGVTHYTLTKNEPIVYNKLYSKFLFPITGHFYHTATSCPEGHLIEYSVLKADFKSNHVKCFVGNHNLPSNHNIYNFDRFYEAEEEYSLNISSKNIENALVKKHEQEKIGSWIEKAASDCEYWLGKLAPGVEDFFKLMANHDGKEFVKIAEPALSLVCDLGESIAFASESYHEVLHGNYKQATAEGVKSAASLIRPVVAGVNYLMPSSVKFVTRPIANGVSKLTNAAVSKITDDAQFKKNIHISALGLKIACTILRLNKAERSSRAAVDAACLRAFKYYSHPVVQKNFCIINTNNIPKALYYARACLYEYNNWPLFRVLVAEEGA